jgi:hypothetical protein
MEKIAILPDFLLIISYCNDTYTDTPYAATIKHDAAEVVWTRVICPSWMIKIVIQVTDSFITSTSQLFKLFPDLLA